MSLLGFGIRINTKPCKISLQAFAYLQVLEEFKKDWHQFFKCLGEFTSVATRSWGSHS
jgi:hypothetical protein